jgi:CRISPR system Cascade subunit CasB
MSTKHESNRIDAVPERESGDSRSSNAPVDFGKSVGSIAKRMWKGGLSTGDMADLRRVSPDNPFTPVLWRILLSQNLDKTPGWYSQETWERRWATLLMGMAHCNGLHHFNIPLGKALAEAGWSELRFVQLMRSRDEMLEDHIRRVAQYLSGKKQSANWVDMAKLLFYQSGKTGEEIRLSISRTYYSTIYAKEKS